MDGLREGEPDRSRPGRDGELPQLADRDEARAELVGEGAAEDEAARLDTDDDLRARLDAIGGELVHDAFEGLRILQEGGDVLEEDPLRREILDVPNLGLQLGHVHAGSPPSVRRGASSGPGTRWAF